MNIRNALGYADAEGGERVPDYRCDSCDCELVGTGLCDDCTEKAKQGALHGFCQCGCVQRTPLAPQTHRKRGWVKGEPLRVVAGHMPRKRAIKRYRERSVGGRSIRLHRLLAERALGKPLPSGVEVHHADGTKSERSPLVICQNRAYHMLHARTRILRAGGNPNTDRICCECKRVLPLAEFYGDGNQCRACRAKREAAHRQSHADQLKAYETVRRQRPERQEYMRRYRAAVR